MARIVYGVSGEGSGHASRARVVLEHLDLGGGLGIRYTDESPPEPAAYAAALKQRLGERRYEILIEPARAIAGNAGILASRVLYTKKTQIKHFVIVDAAMNDLIRPALYGAYHRIEPVALNAASEETVDVVGAVCESSDVFGRDRRLGGLQQGDMLCVLDAGAYGFSMSSNYNDHGRSA